MRLGSLLCFIYKDKEKSLISYTLTPFKQEFEHVFILCTVCSLKLLKLKEMDW